MGALLQGYDELRKSEKTFQLYDFMIRWRDPCEIHGEPIAKRERVFVLRRKVGFHSGRVHVITLRWKRHKNEEARLQIQTRASRQTFWVARVLFPLAPSQEGERAERLTNTLLGAKHGGRHHR